MDEFRGLKNTGARVNRRLGSTITAYWDATDALIEKGHYEITIEALAHERGVHTSTSRQYFEEHPELLERLRAYAFEKKASRAVSTKGGSKGS